MTQSRSFLICVLGFALLAQFTQAAANNCEVTFTTPEPAAECTYEIDENGEQQEICEQVGSVQSFITLSIQQNSVSLSLPTAEIDFDGNCACEYALYTDSGFLSAPTFKGSFDHTTYKNVVVETFLPQEVKTVKISCNF